MRTALIGAVESSRVALHALAAEGWGPDLLITLPPARAGRHSDFADLNDDAAALRVPVHHGANINDETTLERLRSLAPDYVFVIGWSQICGPDFLAIARLGTIGYHPAPLPRMRGRAVMPWTILMQEERSAGTLFWIDEGMDSGPLLAQRGFALDPDESAETLYAKHMQALGAMLPEALASLRLDQPPKLAQNHADATYCARRRPEDGLIDWKSPADHVLRLIRAVGPPYPGAFTFSGGSRMTVLAASHAEDGHRYIGLPGQIQAIDGQRVLVACGDGRCVALTAWSVEDGSTPMLHAKLGTA